MTLKSPLTTRFISCILKPGKKYKLLQAPSITQLDLELDLRHNVENDVNKLQVTIVVRQLNVAIVGEKNKTA